LAFLLIIIFGGYICEPEVKWYLLHEYQKNRVCTLLNPSSDPLGKGFHTIQSIIAIGSGGLFGKGWLNGTQAHLEFIPEKHTDFIFAVFAEEFGLLGNIILLGLFCCLDSAGSCHLIKCSNTLHKTFGRCRDNDFLHLCLCEHGHGQWPATGGRRTAAIHQLWWYSPGDLGHRRGHFDEHSSLPQTCAKLEINQVIHRDG